MPPGSASVCRRAATLTPSPKMSSSFDDDVAKVDADPKLDMPAGRHVGVAAGHSALDLDRALDRVGNALELDQHAVAGGLDDPAVVLGDRRVDQLEPVGPAGARACLPHRLP